MSGSNITPVITPTALTNHFCTILNITINMKDVSMNNLINTEVLAYYKRCHMEVKICILHSPGQSEILELLAEQPEVQKLARGFPPCDA